MWTRIKSWWNETIRDKPYRPGHLAGHYEITKVLGMGSYGIAYLATHNPTGNQVVLKQVKPSLRHTPKGEAMQAYEKKVLMSLSHPQIPRCLDSFPYRKDSFMVMTYIAGPTLEDMLFDQNIVANEQKCAEWIRQIGELVAYLHEQNVIHRDVRIPNVIWKEDKPYLIDFGLARFVGDRPTYTADALSAYPSEKQLKREVAPSSDLYALGHFFLFLLYSGYEPEQDAPERSWEEELSLSPPIRMMIRRLLQMDTPYESVQDWLAELDRYLIHYQEKRAGHP
ncbi:MULTISPECIES: protein kinase [Brevibacillus]|uniref:serine/threonine protein kinase n=1 Tax=Brevibacillus TaxID=55080 RepID=UPI000D108C89|nr:MULTISPECIES: protein kinase [Brevibacillus]MED1943652.1 protein kinase [Brevibacillus formosus]MED1999976.1 protein kinase [Brevibacillus formosus]MED2081887.1 protein kinase [Brevibacillus formosus]PSK19171.1 protein kinase [Brevibacillus sp. NRRL NRS-603]